MANTFTSAPYILLPGGNTVSGVRGIQDVVNQLQSLLDGDSGSPNYGTPSAIINYRKLTFDSAIRSLNIALEPSSYQYDGFIDRTLIKTYIDYAKSTFDAKAFVVPAEVYGVEMNYNPITGGFKPVTTSVVSPLTPVTPSTKILLPAGPVVSTFTVSYLDSAVSVTEGEDIVLRLQLSSSDHQGVTIRPEFQIYNGMQFTQPDVVRLDNSNYILPEAKFAPGSTYTEIRLGTVDDSTRELDEAVKMSESNSDSPFKLSTEGHTLYFKGSPVVTIKDNDWITTPAPTLSATASNIVNNTITITGSNNVVNAPVTNTTITNTGGTVNFDGRQYFEKVGTDKDDNLVGTDSDDRLVGGSGSDNLTGGLGDDRVMGGLGTDILFGNQGNDILLGNEGADFMYGGKGDDLLSPGQGHDIMVGGKGADKFVLAKGHDTIKDFNFLEGDRILLYGENNVTYGMSEGNLIIHRDIHTTTLEGVTFASFDPTKAVLMMG
jgi:Ca2+-binding RTX toxin-like protein